MLQPVEDILALFFPEYCAGCRAPITQAERALCSACRLNLPRTGFHNAPDNPVEKIFWGRVPLHMATCFLHFSKAGVVQSMLHELKYRDGQEVGEILGKLFARELCDAPRLGEIDCLVPVPLHPKKLLQRGYNQCDAIVRGISEILEVPISLELHRIHHNASQTRKGRFQRWQNVSRIFEVTPDHNLENKHVLLIDDVITTGSTIDACAQALLEIKGLKLSVGAIAYSAR